MLHEKYIALSCICKENLQDIVEWIEYHKAIGVDYFILYNNDNMNDLKKLLPEYLKNVTSVVEWYPNDISLSYNDFDKRQISSQIHCIKNYSDFRWIGFLDIDEFIVLLDIHRLNIKEYLTDYENYDGVCLHWLMFGSNNLITKQESTIYSYTQSCPNNAANQHIKSIINPKAYIPEHTNPHFMCTKRGSVNVYKNPVTSAFGDGEKPIIDHLMRINHYYTKSLEDFQFKKNRYGHSENNKRYTESHFDSLQNENVYNNDIIILYDKIKNEHSY